MPATGLQLHLLLAQLPGPAQSPAPQRAAALLDHRTGTADHQEPPATTGLVTTTFPRDRQQGPPSLVVSDIAGIKSLPIRDCRTIILLHLLCLIVFVSITLKYSENSKTKQKKQGPLQPRLFYPLKLSLESKER